MRQGAHHAAQQSTKTGSEESTAASNVPASASTIQGSALWQKPHRGMPGALPGKRLGLPQFVHLVVEAECMWLKAGAVAPVRQFPR
jgi:hypothetical protein